VFTVFAVYTVVIGGVRASAATAFSPRGSRTCAGTMRSARPRAKRRRIAAITRRSSARRRSHTGHRSPSGSTLLTITSATLMPLRSSAATPSSLSANDSSSASVTQ
jgi:hypothetical protein